MASKKTSPKSSAKSYQSSGENKTSAKAKASAKTIKNFRPPFDENFSKALVQPKPKIDPQVAQAEKEAAQNLDAFAARPRKNFGQHWLRSESVFQAIIKGSQLQPTDQILEIGPGTGNLTQRMLPFVAQVVAVEVDWDLCAKLRQNFTQPNFTLIEGNVLELPLPEGTNKVVANIPYNITGEILRKLLGTIAAPVTQFSQVVLLVQKEIADRLISAPGHKAYNALSVRTQYLADCSLVCEVPPEAFFPKPKVTSAIVKICPRPPLVPVSNPQLMDRLLTMGFATRRKMLRNNLQPIIDRHDLIPLLESFGLNDTVRAEELSVSQWISLTEAVALRDQATTDNS
ncbi:MAG: 16S rRNA (adenine(1518)-N(6)/adenine(1519)-N(6))-dimethyltransferase RsmA [Pseudanabaenaceae cyanobacterium]|jgi:16S rRNA (adenine1518-N6/adenine1519-N6)-dimethyltransferase